MSARRLLIWMFVAVCPATLGLVPVGASADELPDGRVYELVTPPDNNYSSEVYQPQLPGTEYSNTFTELPFEAAADGNRVTYVGGATAGGNEAVGYGAGNQYLAVRAPGGGWTQVNISAPEAPHSLYQAFSSNLTTGFLESIQPLTSTAPGFGESTEEFVYNYADLYSTDMLGGGYVPFFTVKPPYRSMGSFETGGAVFGPFGIRPLGFAGASTDSTHLLFWANDALTGASEGRPAAEGGAGSTFENKNNLYEVANGQLRLVNVLPNGTTHVDATFGSGPNLYARLSHVISSDGSRIFWTDLATGHIYVRENGTTTTEISSAGKYETATSDGSAVFYVNGDLYKYELESAQTNDLSPGVPVEKVIGASEDGKYVYFVTTGGQFKLWHDGVTTTIAAPAVRGEVTPDGHSVLFVDSYFNNEHVNLYDADTETLYCTSCTNTGSNGYLPRNNSENVYLPRYLSADGSRVFYVSYEPLVPQDINGRYDVYEWERPGAGNCNHAGGCVYLLSEGTSSDQSYLIDASENGSDVFISTRAKLLGADDNELFDVYDARVDGHVPVSPPACTGTGCQGIPNAPPIFATPSSVTFEGVGNFPPPSKAKLKAKPKPKKTSKHQKHKKKSVKKKSARKAGSKRSGSKGVRS